MLKKNPKATTQIFINCCMTKQHEAYLLVGEVMVMAEVVAVVVVVVEEVVVTG